MRKNRMDFIKFLCRERLKVKSGNLSTDAKTSRKILPISSINLVKFKQQNLRKLYKNNKMQSTSNSDP